MDSFSDCLNAQHETSSIRRRKASDHAPEQVVSFIELWNSNLYIHMCSVWFVIGNLHTDTTGANQRRLTVEAHYSARYCHYGAQYSRGPGGRCELRRNWHITHSHLWIGQVRFTKSRNIPKAYDCLLWTGILLSELAFKTSPKDSPSVCRCTQPVSVCSAASGTDRCREWWSRFSVSWERWRLHSPLRYCRMRCRLPLELWFTLWLMIFCPKRTQGEGGVCKDKKLSFSIYKICFLSHQWQRNAGDLGHHLRIRGDDVLGRGTRLRLCVHPIRRPQLGVLIKQTSS